MITINLTSDDTRALINNYLQVLNIINPKVENKLTEGEIRILTEFILLPEKYSYQRFSRYAKPKVLENLLEVYDWNLSPVNLNCKIYDLIDKEFIWRDDDGVLYIKKYLLDNFQKLDKDRKILITFDDSTKNR